MLLNIILREFNLSRPILSFDDIPIRDINSEQASYILTQCYQLMGDIADEATQQEFKERAPKILGSTLNHRKNERETAANEAELCEDGAAEQEG